MNFPPAVTVVEPICVSPSQAVIGVPVVAVNPFTIAVPMNTWGASFCAKTDIGKAATSATIVSRARILVTFAIDSSYSYRV